LKEGDVITTLNSKPVRNGHDLQTLIARQEVGKAVELRLMRDGQAKTLSVTIEEQPQKYGTPRVRAPRRIEREPDGVGISKIGVEVVDLSEEMASNLGYKEGTRGAMIAKVDADGLAAEAGLVRGMLVTKVDKKPVKSARELREAIDAASLENGVLLQVETPRGGTNFVLLKSSKSAKP
jgi:serine protease Do